MNQQDILFNGLKDSRATWQRRVLSSIDYRRAISVFGSNVQLNFEDGSYALFKYAFYLVDKESNEIAVFTEHCGYHIFPLSGTTIKLLESKRSEVGPE